MGDEVIGDVYFQLGVNGGNEFDNQIKQHAKSAENAFSSSMKKVAGFVAGAFAVGKIISFGKEAVNQATQIQSAFTGLKSIADGAGKSFSSAQNFINEYTKDGLISVTEAATAYKNLLSRGYDTTQIQNTMTALKDSAAFGRQASYDLGEAVVTATEGLKNENSILVDNAGVTKNVAKMWQDWASAHNTTTQAMTQAQKIEAEYNGILQETKFQTGDAATYTKTFGGQVQQLKMNFTNLKVAIGQVVAPLAQLFIPIINSALSALTSFVNGISAVLKVFGLSFPTVVSKASNGISGVGKTASDTSKSISGTGKAAKKAAKEINKAFASVDEINVLNNNKDSSSESGSVGSGGGVSDSSPLEIVPTINDSGLSQSVSGIVDKIMKYINPLKDIKFDNLITAFDNLKKALEPYVKSLFSGLEWFYFNILVPLAKWTIEDLLPGFLNALSGALNFLKPILEGVQKTFMWFWDNFLQPVASWTGGVIVDVLNAIGDAFNWISQNETATSILETVGEILGGVLMAGVAVVTIQIKLLIGFIDLLVKGWNILKDAALTAWNKIKETWNTVANWFNENVITPIKNFFSPILNWFSELFTSIWKTISDIWSNIVGIFQGVVESIKLIFGVVYGWFNEKVFTPLKNTFNTLFNPLKEGAKKAWEGIKSVFSTVASFFKNTFTSAWEGVKKVFSVGGKIFDGIKDGIVNCFKSIVNTIIGGINKVVSIPFKGINSALTKIKNISILGVEPFKDKIKTISIPEIPKLAQGGYAERNNPQLAIIGDNTREGEIVSPESKIYDQTLKAIKDAGGGKQEIELHLYHHYEDGRVIIQKINQTQIDAGEVLLLT